MNSSPTHRNKIRAVIFDMDGVLIDAKEWHYVALNRALAHFGYSIDREDHLRKFDGLPTSTKLEMLTTTKSLPRSIHPIINELKQLYTVELIHQKCRPLFLHEYALVNLRRRGYLLAVGSNSIRTTIDLMLDRAHLTGYFHSTLSAQEVTEPKPSPDIYIELFHRLGISPREALILEDNFNGKAAAYASGAYVMEIDETTDVTLKNILKKIESIDE